MESYEEEIMALSKKHLKLQTLMHYVNRENLIIEHIKQNADKATGIDGVSKDEYELHLEENLDNLLSKMKTFSYRPQAVKRVYIPKANGKLRPLGIPAYEDKLVQGVMAHVLNGVYEPRFLDCSYGFRPNRGAHNVIKAIDNVIFREPIGWVVEADIKGFFDNLDHAWLMKFLEQDIADKNFLRYIVRFLRAGVMEKGDVEPSEAGSPQGGLISPVLANVYLHYVLDAWFETEVVPRMKGIAHLYRYADDFVALFQYESDAKRFFEVLPKRLGKYGLEVAEDKTRILPFGRNSHSHETFDFLGFTFINGKSRKGAYMVVVRTSKKKLKAKKEAMKAWLHSVMHQPIPDIIDMLNCKLLGHYHYYGVNGNFLSLRKFYHYCKLILHKTLRRRSQKHRITFDKYLVLLEKFPIVLPKIYVQIW